VTSHDPYVAQAQRELDIARRNRVRDRDAQSLTTEFDGIASDVRRISASVGKVGAAWAAVVPEHLARNTRVSQFSSGQLTVEVSDSATMFELGRFLRAGGEAAVCRQGPAGLRRVRLILATSRRESAHSPDFPD
jgi:hypothetical protein